MLTSLLPSYISLAVNTTAAHQAACESYVSAASVGVDYLRLIHPDTYALTEVSIRARVRPTENDSKSEIRLKRLNTGGSDVLFEKKDVHGGPLTLGKVNSSGSIRWETGGEWHPNECDGFYQTSTLSPHGVVLFYHPVKKRFQMKYYDNLWWTREFSGVFRVHGVPHHPRDERWETEERHLPRRPPHVERWRDLEAANRFLASEQHEALS